MSEHTPMLSALTPGVVEVYNSREEITFENPEMSIQFSQTVATLLIAIVKVFVYTIIHHKVIQVACSTIKVSK